jgi:hypothetical protein
VRVYRNSLRKAVFEYVGYPGLKFDLEQVHRTYPICKFAFMAHDPAVRGCMPFPDRRNA